MKTLLQNSILTFLISVTPMGGLELAIAQGQQQELTEEADDQDGKEEKVKHDHSEAFYTHTFNVGNISKLEKELKEHPTSRGYVRLSDMYCERNQLPRGKLAAEKAIKLDPKNWEGYQNLGAILGDFGLYEEGLKQLGIARKLSHKRPEPYYSSGLIEQKRKRFSAALSWYKKALEMDPNDSQSLEAIKKINEKLHIFK